MSLRLAEIWIYPVKALRGVRVPVAEVVPRGLAHDRRYMVVDANGRFVTQREQPSLAAVEAEIADGALHVRTPGGEATARTEGEARRVTVWGDPVDAVHAGDEASALLSAHLGAPVELVYMPEGARRPADQEFARPDDLVSFADGFPFLVTTHASLDALSVRLGHSVPMRRFRPNLVLDGAEAWEEDRWQGLTIGPVSFRTPKPCGRCAVVDVDPERGVRDPGVLAELSRFRKKDRQVVFGMNFTHDGRGTLEEGMNVTARVEGS